MTTSSGYCDRINHAFAFAAKHRPPPADKFSGFHGSVRSGNVAVILARYEASHASIIASILAQLLEEVDDTHRTGMGREIRQKFGPEIGVILDEVVLPPRLIMGRERSWKAHRLDYLGQLSRSRAEAIDVVMAEAIHYAGCLGSDVKRLGVEYVQTIVAAGPEETAWWFESLAQAVALHERWSRPDMLSEFRRLLLDFRRLVRP